MTWLRGIGLGKKMKHLGVILTVLPFQAAALADDTRYNRLFYKIDANPIVKTYVAAQAGGTLKVVIQSAGRFGWLLDSIGTLHPNKSFTCPSGWVHLPFDRRSCKCPHIALKLPLKQVTRQ
jgi:hypothetical protein